MIVDAALAYARRGMPVFPCGGKLPLTRRGCLDATTDAERIRAMWARRPDANVAIATGNGYAVLDVDPRHRGDESLARLEAEHGDLATLSCRTPSGGSHLWFRVPAGVAIGNSVGRVGEGLDVRGEHGFVIVPPSVSALGTAYSWERRKPVTTMPQWLVERARKREPMPRRDLLIPTGLALGEGGSRYGLSALEREADDVRHAPEGTRNQRLNVAAFSLGQLVAGGELSESAVVAELTVAALAAGLTPREVTGENGSGGTLASGLQAGMRHPRGATRAA